MCKPKIQSNMLNKGNTIGNKLINGEDYHIFKGKRLTLSNRNLVSIKLNKVTRLLFNLENKSFQILTHAQYNKLIGNCEGKGIKKRK